MCAENQLRRAFVEMERKSQGLIRFTLMYVDVDVDSDVETST